MVPVRPMDHRLIRNVYRIDPFPNLMSSISMMVRVRVQVQVKLMHRLLFDVEVFLLQSPSVRHSVLSDVHHLIQIRDFSDVLVQIRDDYAIDQR